MNMRLWDGMTRWTARAVLFGLFLTASAARASDRPRAVDGSNLPAETAANCLRAREEWHRPIFSTAIGLAGLQVADLDGSGKQKIVAAARRSGYSVNRLWYVLSRSPSGYQHEWASAPYSDDMSGLRTVDLDGAPGAEVVVSVGGQVLIYDGSTRELIRRVQTSVTSIEGLQIADSDGDGDLEILFCAGGLHVYDATTGAEEHYSEDLVCSDVAVGEVDGDPSPEIVLGRRETPVDDSAGYVLDGATYTPEWTYHSGFGGFVRLGDVDGDGLEEIVAGSRSGYITVYDADLRSPAWEIVAHGYLAALRVMDVEGDGRLDIVYGDDQWGSVHVWDAQARTLKWSIPNPETGVTDLAVGDTDGDGVNELVWGGEEERLFVASTVTQELEWWSEDVRGPFRALDFGDVDHDGEPELLYGSDSSETGDAEGRYFIHDARTKVLEYQSSPSSSRSWASVWRIRHGDVDRDPQPEIFITKSTGGTHEGILLCRDGISQSEEWQWLAEDGPTGLYSLEILDVDADTEAEIVAGGNHHLFVFDAATGHEEWHSDPLSSMWNYLPFLRVADVDRDPHLEILVAGGRSRLFIYDAVTHEQQLQTDDLFITALETTDRNGDGKAEIVVGTESSGRLKVLDSSTGAVVETLGDYGSSVGAVVFRDLTNDLVPDLIVATSGEDHYSDSSEEIRVYDGRFPSELLWRSGVIGWGVGADDTLRVADIDQDGKIEILVNLGELGLKIFQVEGVRTCVPDLPPGPYLEPPDLPGFRFKVRITADDRAIAGSQEADCLGETLCVSGALAGRSEMFARIIGPRPNGYLWVNLVRFTPSRVEVWVEQTSSGQVNYYDLPALPREDTELTGLVDKEAFLPAGADGVATLPIRARPLGTPGVEPFEPPRPVNPPPPVGAFPNEATFTSPAFPGYRFTVRILSNAEEQPVQVEPDCIPETVCVSGALPGRSELFLRMIGPRPNGYLWVNLVRFTTSRVEVDIEQLATGETNTYFLEQVPRESDELPGRLDKEAFSP